MDLKFVSIENSRLLQMFLTSTHRPRTSLVNITTLLVPLNPKMDRGSTGSGLTTKNRGKNQQAGKFPETRTYNPSDGNLQL